MGMKQKLAIAVQSSIRANSIRPILSVSFLIRSFCRCCFLPDAFDPEHRVEAAVAARSLQIVAAQSLSAVLADVAAQSFLQCMQIVAARHGR